MPEALLHQLAEAGVAFRQERVSMLPAALLGVTAGAGALGAMLTTYGTPVGRIYSRESATRMQTPGHRAEPFFVSKLQF